MFGRIIKVLVDPSEGMVEVTANPEPFRPLLFNVVVVACFAIINAVHFSSLAPSNFLAFYWTTSILVPLGAFLLKVTSIAVGLVFLSSFLLGNATFRQSMAVAAYSYIPVNVLSYGLSVVLIVNHWTTSIQPTSFAVLDEWLPANIHSVVRLLSLIDPFKMWAVFLVAVGFSKATKCAVKKGIIPIFVSWMALVTFQYSIIFR